jgi:hypothetical protein
VDGDAASTAESLTIVVHRKDGGLGTVAEA